MQMRHGRNEAEAKAITRGAATAFKPVETLENMREFVGRDAGSIVGDGDQRIMFERPHRHSHQPVLFPVFDGVIDEIGHGIEEEVTIPSDHNTRISGNR